MQIFVTMLGGITITLGVSKEDTVLTLKQRLFEKTGLHVNLHNLMFAGKRLDETHTLGEYNIVNESALHSSLTYNIASEVDHLIVKYMLLLQGFNDEQSLLAFPQEILANIIQFSFNSQNDVMKYLMTTLIRSRQPNFLLEKANELLYLVTRHNTNQKKVPVVNHAHYISNILRAIRIGDYHNLSVDKIAQNYKIPTEIVKIMTDFIHSNGLYMTPHKALQKVEDKFSRMSLKTIGMTVQKNINDETNLFILKMITLMTGLNDKGSPLYLTEFKGILPLIIMQNFCSQHAHIQQAVPLAFKDKLEKDEWLKKVHELFHVTLKQARKTNLNEEAVNSFMETILRAIRKDEYLSLTTSNIEDNCAIPVDIFKVMKAFIDKNKNYLIEPIQGFLELHIKMEKEFVTNKVRLFDTVDNKRKMIALDVEGTIITGYDYEHPDWKGVYPAIIAPELKNSLAQLVSQGFIIVLATGTDKSQLEYYKREFIKAGIDEFITSYMPEKHEVNDAKEVKLQKYSAQLCVNKADIYFYDDAQNNVNRAIEAGFVSSFQVTTESTLAMQLNALIPQKNLLDSSCLYTYAPSLFKNEFSLAYQQVAKVFIDLPAVCRLHIEKMTAESRQENNMSMIQYWIAKPEICEAIYADWKKQQDKKYADAGFYSKNESSCTMQ